MVRCVSSGVLARAPMMPRDASFYRVVLMAKKLSNNQTAKLSKLLAGKSVHFRRVWRRVTSIPKTRNSGKSTQRSGVEPAESDMMWHAILRPSFFSAHCAYFMSRWSLLRRGGGLHIPNFTPIFSFNKIAHLLCEDGHF